MNAMLSAKAFLETPAVELTQQVEREFFGSLMLRNGTYKTTFHQRFADTNPLLLQELKRDGFQAPDILDIGISSGISTVELHDDLRAAGLDAHIVATDLLVEALLVRVFPTCYALVESDGFPLRFDLLSGTMKPWVTHSDYRYGFFILRKAINVAMTHLSQRILCNPNDLRITRAKLVTPRLLDDRNIVVCNDDISHYNREFAGRFDLVRAANVLNKGYFTPDTLSTMLANIARYRHGPR
ncbi:MAG: ATP/GTP-binding protein, partial [Gammaproteobacteria bacterium]